MKEVSIFDAKTHFSGLIDQVYQQHDSITITRRGVPIAMIVPIEEEKKSNAATLLREMDVLAEEIGRVGVGLKEIKKMKDEGKR
jgi:prevent-host-death family protein